jgi:uncharacterized RDD family membrane protein YckC
MFCSSCGKQTSDTSAFCGSCGRPIVGYSVGGSSSASMPAYAGAVAAGASVAVASPPQAGTSAYAGFWLRFVAAIIDGLVLGIPAGILVVMMVMSMLPTVMQNAQANPQDPKAIMAFVVAFASRFIFISVLLIIGGWLYWGLMESSSWQATLGKKALGLYVTDLAGVRLTFGRASGRYFAGRAIGTIPFTGVTSLYYLVDCIVAGFTERKQALHDMIAGCLVLRNN